MDPQGLFLAGNLVQLLLKVAIACLGLCHTNREWDSVQDLYSELKL